MFCSDFLTEALLLHSKQPEDAAFPTCNHLRKWFHSTMRRKANSPDNIKRLLMHIDPHGEAVMDKHYILKSPQDHVDIAKAVYHEIMGEVTAWPTAEEAHDYDNTKWLGELLPADFQEDADFREDDEYEDQCYRGEGRKLRWYTGR